MKTLLLFAVLTLPSCKTAPDPLSLAIEAKCLQMIHSTTPAQQP